MCYVWNGSGIALYSNGVSLATSSNSDSMVRRALSALAMLMAMELGAGNSMISTSTTAHSPLGESFTLRHQLRWAFRRLAKRPRRSSTSCSSGLTCGLVGYWTFDGKDINWTMAATTTDRSGNGNTGTLVNMSATTSPVVGRSVRR